MLILLVGLTTNSANAKVYKWTDESGKVHYSDKPVDVKSEAIKIKNQPSDTDIKAAKQRASKMIDLHKKRTEIANEEMEDRRNLEAKAENDKLENKKACAEARRLILVYSGRGNVYREQANGKRKYLGLTDEQKNEKFDKAEK